MSKSEVKRTVGAINRFAEEEGWVLAEVDGRGITICAHEAEGYFRDNDEAFFWVKAQARHGSALHQRAMKLHLKHIDTVTR